MTAYNWENNASNSGTDYCQGATTICSHEDNYMFPAGVNFVNNQPATTLTDFVHGNNALGADSLITLQTAGYVSADPTCNCFVTITGAADTSGTYWKGVSFVKGSAFADPPVTTDMWVYMDELMHYLGVHLGYSASGGAKYYDLDNEPALWNSTHPMVHPAQPTCAEVSSKGISLATVITQYDTSAQILGPVAYGWGEYVDNQTAPDTIVLGPYINGNDVQYLNYYLHQMNTASTSVGRRLLHRLDLHWYPEATGLDAGATVRITNDDVTQQVAIARMQAPRSLWDPTYTEASWIAQYSTNGPITLIPRLQDAVNNYYPGTKLSFSEYQYGAGEDISGGIAEADALGIFSKYGVMASWWPDGSVSDAYLAAAFRFYLNYDGSNSKFGDTSISATSSGANAVSLTSVYAAKDNSHPNRINMIILNKDYTNPHNAAVTLNNLLGGQTISSIAAYRFDSASSIILGPTVVAHTTNTFSDSLLKLSATLYQITLSVPFPTSTPTTGGSAPTPTNTPTLTPSNSPTKTPTTTPTPTPTASPTSSPTNSPTSTPTPSPTRTPSPTPTQTPTNSPTPTITLTETLTATNSPSSTPTASPTGTLPTTTNTTTNSPTSTPTSTATQTPSNTPTNSPSNTYTATNSPTVTPTSSPTTTPTNSTTSTFTNTATKTPTLTPSNSPTNSPTITNTASFTITSTPTYTTTITWTPTNTNTPSNGPPVGVPIIYYNPVTVSGPVTAVFTLRDPVSQLSLKIFTTAFRKVQETSMTNVPAGSVSVKLDLLDKFGTPLANGLYYLLVTVPQGHSVGKILILR